MNICIFWIVSLCKINPTTNLDSALKSHLTGQSPSCNATVMSSIDFLLGAQLLFANAKTNYFRSFPIAFPLIFLFLCFHPCLPPQLVYDFMCRTQYPSGSVLLSSLVVTFPNPRSSLFPSAFSSFIPFASPICYFFSTFCYLLSNISTPFFTPRIPLVPPHRLFSSHTLFTTVRIQFPCLINFQKQNLWKFIILRVLNRKLKILKRNQFCLFSLRETCPL